jgi:uncharacterized tellurite resistance protein B-like protein
MPKDKNDAHTYLLTPEQAAFDILYVLMMADGQADDSEFEVVKDYLKTEFARKGSLFNEKHSLYSSSNFASEFAYLQQMDAKSLRSRFHKAVRGFHEWIGTHPDAETLRNDLLDFSFKLIAADGALSASEKELMLLIGKEWGIDLSGRLS